ncbi:MAG: serine protease [Bacteroidota bacterium]
MKIFTILSILMVVTSIDTAFCQKYYSESSWIESFNNRLEELDNIEGIYKVNIDYKYTLQSHSYRTSESKLIAITKVDNKYIAYTINGDDFYFSFLKQSSSSYICILKYSYNNTDSRKNISYSSSKIYINFQVPNYFAYNDTEIRNWLFNQINVNFYIVDEKKLFTGETNGLKGNIDYALEKIYPTFEEIENSKNRTKSGSGFAISSNGYIVTNHHVIANSKSINVKGINGDFSKSYNASVVVEDKNNDLSIIKINESINVPIENIPYKIPNKSSEAGTSVFVLGYPLRATMGDEIKLTNGIISSKSGFQGDVTSYQISAPVQPGNSGGPVFDDKGNLIGIINAKYNEAENVSYAIKVLYLSNLIDALPVIPKSASVNILLGKSLAEQVKVLKKFVYIIEVN